MYNNLFGQNEDGANAAAKAVKAYLCNYSGIESSWSTEYKRYMAEPKIGRWENCREQGYVVSMRNLRGRQINIAFYEHRNTDDICALVWEQVTLNSPTINTIPDGIFSSKYDYTHSVDRNGAIDMARYIFETLGEFWGE